MSHWLSEEVFTREVPKIIVQNTDSITNGLYQRQACSGSTSLVEKSLEIWWKWVYSLNTKYCICNYTWQHTTTPFRFLVRWTSSSPSISLQVPGSMNIHMVSVSLKSISMDLLISFELGTKAGRESTAKGSSSGPSKFESACTWW